MVERLTRILNKILNRSFKLPSHHLFEAFIKQWHRTIIINLRN